MIKREQEPFSLGNLSDDRLNYILSMDLDEKTVYFSSLIEKYYPNAVGLEEEQSRIMNAYNSSFIAEKLYRSNKAFASSFTVVYTKTGLIRDVVNDIYYNSDHLITH